MNYLQKFKLLGYKENNYTDKDGKTVEQYLLNVCYEHKNYTGLFVRQVYVDKSRFGDVDIAQCLYGDFTAECLYNKRLERVYIQKILKVVLDDGNDTVIEYPEKEKEKGE